MVKLNYTGATQNPGRESRPNRVERFSKLPLSIVLRLLGARSQKLADVLLQKKRLPPGSGSKAAARDPSVDLDLTGKELTDDGVSVFVDDLIRCMQYRDEDHPHGTVRLTELSLKGNSLTVMSMERLGPVISLGSITLSKLDISDNLICIVTDDDRKAWNNFLSSFQECCVLKKIDFSGNNLGGPGFDVLAHVYMKSDLDFIDCNSIGNGHPRLVMERDKEEQITTSLDSIDLNAGKKNTNLELRSSGVERFFSPTEMQVYARKRGLRSVPYLAFNNVCTTYACAFHLWNISMSHDPPERLLEYLPAGKCMAPLEINGSSTGIAYVCDETLGSLGRRLLELGNEAREGMLFTESDEIDTPDSEVDDERDETIKLRELRRAKQVEMGRVKNRLLLDIVRTDGLHSVEIWSVAFKMMVVARTLLLEKKEHKKPVKTDEDEGKECGQQAQPKQNHQEHEYATRVWCLNLDEEFPTLQRANEKDQTEDKVTTGLNSPARKVKEPRSSSGTDNSMTRCSTRPRAASFRNGAKTIIKSNVRFGLPMELWRIIISKAIDEKSVLSKQQQMQVLRYASDWAAIKQELRLQGGLENEQMWKILSSMGCLAYSDMD